MARSRSSFEHLTTAIQTATSLTSTEEAKAGRPVFDRAPLVSFDTPQSQAPVETPKLVPPPPASSSPRTESSPRHHEPPAAPASASALSGQEPVPTAPPELAPSLPDRAPASVASEAPASARSDASPPDAEQPATAEAKDAGAQPEAAPPNPVDDVSNDRRTPPKLPDLSSIVSPVVRCEKIVSWIAEATGAVDVFLADAAGFPLAGSIRGVEAKLAGAGLVAASVTSLAAAIPGNVSPLFELHFGEGPFFQLIGFQAGSAVYVVGFTRPTPLTPRQSHAIRLACRHALGDTLRGAALETE